MPPVVHAALKDAVPHYEEMQPLTFP